MSETQKDLQHCINGAKDNFGGERAKLYSLLARSLIRNQVAIMEGIKENNRLLEALPNRRGGPVVG